MGPGIDGNYYSYYQTPLSVNFIVTETTVNGRLLSTDNNTYSESNTSSSVNVAAGDLLLLVARARVESSYLINSESNGESNLSCRVSAGVELV